MKYKVRKTYGHNLGFSTTFRQWKANSHCRYMHGYALQIELVFGAPHLNANNWVIDFGSLKLVKKWLEDTFDHKTLVAKDDPALPFFRDGAKEYHGDPQRKLFDLIEVEATGCEAFAIMIGNFVESFLEEARADGLLHGGDNGVKLLSVEVSEHAGNAAIYYPADSREYIQAQEDWQPS